MEVSGISGLQSDQMRANTTPEPSDAVHTVSAGLDRVPFCSSTLAESEVIQMNHKGQLAQA